MTMTKHGSIVAADHDYHGTACSIGVIAAEVSCAHHIANYLRLLGTVPDKVLSFAQLAEQPGILAGLDFAIVKFSEVETGTKESVEAESCVDRLFTCLSTNPGFKAVLLVPLSLADMAWYLFKGTGVTILVDPKEGDVFFGLVEWLRRKPGHRDAGAHAHCLVPGETLHDMADKVTRLSDKVDAVLERLDQKHTEPAHCCELRPTSPPGSYLCTATAETAEEEILIPLAPAGQTVKAPIEDASLIRRVIVRRKARARYFDPDLFADPAWDMLLDLAAARAERQLVSVSSLCIASGVPHTTALRWIGRLTEAGMLIRIEDEADKRRAFIVLSDKAVDALARYLQDYT
ncbi:MAG: hypothetical protein ACK5NN_15555 [Sphingomonadaceae bacterium]